MSIESTLLRADGIGIRLEIVNGLAIREAQPLYRHQKHVEQTAGSIEPSGTQSACACVRMPGLCLMLDAVLP